MKQVLAGKSPTDRARELISGSKLKDPMIALAKRVDEESRKVRQIMESQVEEVSKQAYGDLAKVEFALDGTKTYPDATFTLRLSFGEVKSYEDGGKKVPFSTDFTGLYQRSAEFKNADRWKEVFRILFSICVHLWLYRRTQPARQALLLA